MSRLFQFDSYVGFVVKIRLYAGKMYVWNTYEDVSDFKE